MMCLLELHVKIPKTQDRLGMDFLEPLAELIEWDPLFPKAVFQYIILFGTTNI